jgi:hypothetical protein
MRILRDVRRITGLILLAVLTLAQSGWLNYLHLEEHLSAPHAAALHLSISAPTPGDDHDENNCSVCMNLHMAVSATKYIPLLICLGILVAFLSLLTPRPRALREAVWIEGRGPPAY